MHFVENSVEKNSGVKIFNYRRFRCFISTGCSTQDVTSFFSLAIIKKVKARKTIFYYRFDIRRALLRDRRQVTGANDETKLASH